MNWVRIAYFNIFFLALSFKEITWAAGGA